MYRYFISFPLFPFCFPNKMFWLAYLPGFTPRFVPSSSQPASQVADDYAGSPPVQRLLVNEIKFLGRLELQRLNHPIFPIFARQNCIRPYLAVVSILRINPRFLSFFSVFFFFDSILSPRDPIKPDWNSTVREYHLRDARIGNNLKIAGENIDTMERIGKHRKENGIKKRAIARDPLIVSPLYLVH